MHEVLGPGRHEMAEMSRIGRWFVNLGNARRSRALLDSLGAALRIPASGRILELGAGRGGLSVLLFERYRPSRLVVTDFDPNQVESARAFLTRRLGSIPASVEVRQLDARQIPGDENAFDCVFAINMLHHVESDFADYRERPDVLRQIRRVLVPGGYFVLKDFSHVAALRRTLAELDFVPLYEKSGWRHDYLGLFRSPLA